MSLETINKTMKFVFPSPVKMVKSHGKKFQNFKMSLRYGEVSPKCEFSRDGY